MTEEARSLLVRYLCEAHAAHATHLIVLWRNKALYRRFQVLPRDNVRQLVQGYQLGYYTCKLAVYNLLSPDMDEQLAEEYPMRIEPEK